MTPVDRYDVADAVQQASQALDQIQHAVEEADAVLVLSVGQLEAALALAHKLHATAMRFTRDGSSDERRVAVTACAAYLPHALRYDDPVWVQPNGNVIAVGPGMAPPL